MEYENIFQVLDGATPVFSDEEHSLLITWNRSHTFLVYNVDADRGEFLQINVWTNFSDFDFNEARTMAQEWVDAMNGGAED